MSPSLTTTIIFHKSLEVTILPNSHGYVDLEVRTCSYIHMDRISLLSRQMDYGLVSKQRQKWVHIVPMNASKRCPRKHLCIGVCHSEMNH